MTAAKRKGARCRHRRFRSGNALDYITAWRECIRCGKVATQQNGRWRWVLPRREREGSKEKLG